MQQKIFFVGTLMSLTLFMGAGCVSTSDVSTPQSPTVSQPTPVLTNPKQPEKKPVAPAVQERPTTLLSPSKKYQATIKPIKTQASTSEDIQTQLTVTHLPSGSKTIAKEASPAKFSGTWSTLALGNFFGERDQYLEYFESDFSSVFHLYDIEENRDIPLALTGHFAKSFWYNNTYIVCVDGGLDGWGSSIIAVRPPQWEQVYYIYPEEANTTDLAAKEKVLMDILNNNIDRAGNCTLSGSILQFQKGTERATFDLSVLK